MNRRTQEKIEVRVARVGGDLSDLLGVVKDAMPEEYDSLMESAKSMNDAMRHVRRMAEVAVRESHD